MIGVFWKGSYSREAQWNLIKECKTKDEAKQLEKEERQKHPQVLIFTGIIEGNKKYDI